ncbi:MAG: hypothetical protein ACLTLY_02615 [Agathobacter rectalis]
MNGDRLMYFQHTDISRVVFEGYVDDDEIMMCDNIVNAMEKTEIERADVRKSKEVLVKIDLIMNAINENDRKQGDYIKNGIGLSDTAVISHKTRR